MKITFDCDDTLNAMFEEALPPLVPKSPVLRDLMRVYIRWRDENPGSFRMSDIEEAMFGVETTANNTG